MDDMVEKNMTTTRPILLVEDDENDVFLMKRALNLAEVRNVIHVAKNGQQAVDYLSGVGEFADRRVHPMPAVILLDVKLPLLTGHQVLEWIRGRIAMNNIVVIMLTSSNQHTDLCRAYELGANSYLVKPSSLTLLNKLVGAFKEYWLQFNRFAVA